VQNLPDAQAERYEEYILTATRGNLRIRLLFADNALLEISETFVLVGGELYWLSYRYHYQDASAALVFRYDNAPHHPEIATHPDHKHSGEQILASVHPYDRATLGRSARLPKDSLVGSIRLHDIRALPHSLLFLLPFALSVAASAAKSKGVVFAHSFDVDTLLLHCSCSARLARHALMKFDEQNR